MLASASMRFGFGTVLWGRRIDDLDHCLDVIAACGYQGVEFAQHHSEIFIREGDHREQVRPVKDIAELLRKLRENDRKLELIGLVGGTLRERLEFLGDHRGCYLYLDRWPEKKADQEFHTQVQRCIDAAHTLAFHPHWLMPFCKLEQALQAIKELDSPHARLLMDTAHATIAEDDPVDAAEQYYALLEAVHIKSWVPDYGRWSHRYAHGFCLPGEGIVNVAGVLDKLHEKGWNGWIVLEQDRFKERREETALAGAKWMCTDGARWNFDIAPREDRVAELIAMDKPNPFVLHKTVDRKQIELTQRLARSVEHHHSGKDFYREVAVGLRELSKAMVVKVWSHNPMTDEFCLLGISAERPEFEAGACVLPSSVGPFSQIVQHPTICEWDLHSQQVIEYFHEKDWLSCVVSHGASWITALPVFNISDALQMQFLITVVTKESNIERIRTREMEHYAEGIAYWADRLINETCSVASGATNHLCGDFKGGVTQFLDRLMFYLTDRFDCNGVTIFLEDPTGKHLMPVGTSGQRLDWSEDGGDHEAVAHHYTDPDDRDHFTWKAWKERRMVFSSTANAGKARELRPEEDKWRDEILFAPLARRMGKCHGVVRLHNKKRPSGTKVASMFTDDDAAHLDAVIQAALPYLELLRHREQEIEGMARMVHEFLAPLGAIRVAVDAMRSDLKKKNEVPEEFFRQDFLGMAMNWAEAMGHLARNAHVFASGMATLPPRKRRTLLRQEVVLPVLHQVRPLLKEDMRLEFGYHGFEDIPALWVDRDQFQGVFFNLTTNAMKYAGGTEAVRVMITAGEVGENYCISFSDWGKGIPEEIKEKVFMAKFRSEDAKLLDVSGLGLGLFVVRSIIEAHGGTIRVTSCSRPTTFEIVLPSSLRHAPVHRRP